MYRRRAGDCDDCGELELKCCIYEGVILSEAKDLACSGIVVMRARSFAGWKPAQDDVKVGNYPVIRRQKRIV